MMKSSYRLSCIATRAPRQSGAVLIVAMILLVLLTLLGVTAMNTTSLEEKMASNTQEQVRAFQAAETGLSQAFNDDDSYSESGHNVAPAAFAGTDSLAGYSSQYIGDSNPPEESLYSASLFRAAHFNFQSVGTASGNANSISVTLNGGAYQIAPK